MEKRMGKTVSELEKHIESFPSGFDGTSIAQQLRDEGVPARLYAEIRDVLWLQKKDMAKSLKQLSKRFGAVKEELDEILEELNYWR